MTIDLYNHLGMKVQIIHRGALSPSQKQTFRIDGSELTIGFYFLRVFGSDFETSKQVLIAK